MRRREFIAAGVGALALTSCRDLRKARGLVLGGPPPLHPSLAAPAAAALDDASHFLNRLTFGARPGDHARITAMGVDAFLEEQLAPERIDDSWCHRALGRFENVGSALDEFSPLHRAIPGHPGEMFDLYDNVVLRELTGATITRAAYSQRQLYEVMTHFWSDHFNIDPSKGDGKWLKAWDDREVIRRHALGSFPAMLRASALSPAMLWYLDGRVNRRGKADERANENYARELMELHTLGVHGGYTQQDVMEAARCLTGWAVGSTAGDGQRLGQVRFEKNRHDDGAKRVLGTDIPAGLGEGDLDRLLDIVTRHPATAKYIAEKLCRRFIADAPPAAAVEKVARAFSDAAGDIKATLRALFATPEFHSARGTKFKRPFHYVISAMRATVAETDASGAIANFLQRMGHAPFHYPTPDGYPEEASHWENALLWRWNFAVELSRNRIDNGTKLQLADLTKQLGGDAALTATLLGRAPTAQESAVFTDTSLKPEDRLALLLASPAFQRC